jgi:3-oxoacyl-[acyl-carrier protein] reductase
MKMNFGLTGRRALITGAPLGIGLAIAESLADEGVDIAICSRDPKAVDEQDAFAQSLAANPTGPMGAPQEVADSVAFLASPRCRFTIDAQLLVDRTL